MTTKSVSFREMLAQLEERKNQIIKDAACAAWPGESFGPRRDEVRSGWGDFRSTDYARGDIVIGLSAIDESRKDVFNGIEITRRYPAFKDGVPCIFVEMRFWPESGHADYGWARFDAITIASD